MIPKREREEYAKELQNEVSSIFYLFSIDQKKARLQIINGEK